MMMMIIVMLVVAVDVGVPWLPDEINDGKLEWFSFLLAGVLLVNLLLFVLIARQYRYNCLGVPTTMPGTPNDASTELYRGSRPSVSAGPLLVITLPDPT